MTLLRWARLGKFVTYLARLGWARLGWARLGWARLGWARLGWARLGKNKFSMFTFNTSRIINFSGCNKQCMGSGCPVCGNDQTTYQSLCDLQNAACTNPYIVLEHSGPCGDSEMGT